MAGLLLDTINNALSTQASKLVDQTRRAANADSLHDVLRAVGDLTAEEAQEETLKMLDVYRAFSEEMLARARTKAPNLTFEWGNLVHSFAGFRKEADGGWTFNWLAWSPAAEREWRGYLTVDALRLLRDNGCL